MALVIKDRVLETCSSPGTGTVTLLGAVTGYQTFNAAVGNGNTCYYAIADQSGNNWEVGVGTFTAPATLGRTTVLASSNGGSVVNFAIGTQNVFLTYPADKSVTTDTLAYPPAIGATTPNSGAFTTLTATQDSAFTSTGALQISKGTTLQQPGGATTGMLRYNTTTNLFEGYSGSSPSWNAIGGITIADDTTSVSTYYPLFYTATSGVATAIYVSSTKFTFKPSTGELTATVLASPTFAAKSGGGGVISVTAASTASNFSLTLPALNGTLATTADIIPAGSAMLFVQAAAPTGWTISSTHNNKALRIVSSSGGGSGGSVAFSTAFASQTPSGSVSISGGSVNAYTLSTNEISSHSHGAPYSHGAGATNLTSGAGFPNQSPAYGVPASGYTTYQGTFYNFGTGGRTVVTSTGGGASHSHGFTNPTGSFSGNAINLAVQYVDAIICTKN